MDCKFVAQEPTYARVHVGGVGLSHKRVGGAIAPTGCGGFGRRSIGDNRSTKMVEPLSPMAPDAAQGAASWVFRLLVLLVAVASGADRLGTIDLPRADRLNEEDTAFGPVWVQSHAIESRVSVVKSDRTVVPQKLLASFGFLSGTLNSVFLGR